MLNPKAYKEVNEIIKNLPTEMQDKIPKDIRKDIEYNCDKNYSFSIDNLKELKLLKDTEKILSVLYTDYFSTEKERKVIVAKELLIEAQKEKEKQKNYPLDFMKNRKCN